MLLIFAGILTLIGLIVGFLAIFAADGALACVLSIVMLMSGTLLIQEAQHPKVFPILMKAIRQRRQHQT
jgi:hypothetical protein